MMDDWTLAMDIRSLTEHTVAQAARAAGITVPPRYVDVTGSTNSDLLALAGQGAPEWTVLVAGQQEAGRGRLGRTWESNPGQSLLVSVLLRPDVPAEQAPLLSLAAGVSMGRACDAASGVTVRCKWPNDLVVGERKLGGILAEAGFTGGTVDHVVIGIGVNVRQHRDDLPEEIRKTATSVVIEGGLPDRMTLLAEYLRELRARAERPEDALTEYRALCESLGRRVRAAVASGQSIEGTAVDIGPSGELLIETAEGTKSVGFGEITHLD